MHTLLALSVPGEARVELLPKLLPILLDERKWKDVAFALLLAKQQWLDPAILRRLVERIAHEVREDDSMSSQRVFWPFASVAKYVPNDLSWQDTVWRLIQHKYAGDPRTVLLALASNSTLVPSVNTVSMVPTCWGGDLSLPEQATLRHTDGFVASAAFESVSTRTSQRVGCRRRDGRVLWTNGTGFGRHQHGNHRRVDDDKTQNQGGGLGYAVLARI